MQISAFAARFAPPLLSILRIRRVPVRRTWRAEVAPLPVPRSSPTLLMSMSGVAGVFELIGGSLLLFGLFTRPVAFLLSGLMAFA